MRVCLVLATRWLALLNLLTVRRTTDLRLRCLIDGLVLLLYLTWWHALLLLHW